MGEPPPEPERPAFRDTALVYMRVLERLCQRLVPIYAIALDMPADTFDAACAEPRIILRMSHYPPLGQDENDDFSLVPHTDSGFMILLAPNPVPPASRSRRPTVAGSTLPVSRTRSL